MYRSYKLKTNRKSAMMLGGSLVFLNVLLYLYGQGYLFK